MDVRAIREQLGKALEGQGYRVYSELPESGQLPLAAVGWPDQLTYNTTMGDGVALDLTVTVAVAAKDFGRAQKAIDAAISTPGFGAAIEAHDSAGAWHSAVCTSASNIRLMTVGSVEALAVEFAITLHA